MISDIQSRVQLPGTVWHLFNSKKNLIDSTVLNSIEIHVDAKKNALIVCSL